MQTLKKGEKYSIDSTIKRLDIEIGWDAPNNYDINGSAFLLNKQGKVQVDSDMIFYNNPSSLEHSVIRLEPLTNNQEQFLIELDMIPLAIERIAFVLTIHESTESNKNFRKVKSLNVNIRNGFSGTALVSFPMGNFTNETAIISFELYRYRNGWKINAVSSGFYGGLDDICIQYGLTVEKPLDFPAANSLSGYSFETSDLEMNLYENMINRKTKFEVIIHHRSIDQVQKDLQIAFENLYAKDHYLERSINSQEFQISHLNRKNTITICMKYRTNKDQELVVDRKIKEIIYAIPIHLTIFDKVKYIHDFIVLNVNYDQTLTEYTAYAALTKGYTVCQGYAQLLYRLLNELGIETIIVKGHAKERRTGRAEGHAWNMVKINNCWYHIDCTWDDPIGSNKIHYDYFLISDLAITKSHSWETDKYPVAPINYIQ